MRILLNYDKDILVYILITKNNIVHMYHSWILSHALLVTNILVLVQLSVVTKVCHRCFAKTKVINWFHMKILLSCLLHKRGGGPCIVWKMEILQSFCYTGRTRERKSQRSESAGVIIFIWDTMDPLRY
jgi:hypothetical protein